MAKKKSTKAKLKLVSSGDGPTSRKPNILVIWDDDIVQKPNTFTVDDALDKISAIGGGS